MSKTTDKVLDLMNQDLTASSNGSPQKSKFQTYKAIAAFQQECPVVHKGTKGYGYSYADLTSIFKIIMPLMKKHNLGFMQLVEGTSLKTIIFHTKNEDALPIESSALIPQDVQLKGMNAFQVYGSALTYFRRYTLSSNLGIITDKDIDATGEQIKPEIDEETFNKALQAIEAGTYTIAKLKANFSLTNEQLKQV